jgi:hypothetical protein
MKLHPKQIEAVIKLDGPTRYDHFIKQAADKQEVWGLYKDGWALATTDDGESVFPVWPAEEYASLCAQKEWAGYKPSSISIGEYIHELLPKLKRDNILPGIFYTSSNNGVTPTIDELVADLNLEMQRYE